MIEGFPIGSKVNVFQNSERIDSCSFINKHGIVVGYQSNDVMVYFPNFGIYAIWYKDLELA